MTASAVAEPKVSREHFDEWGNEIILDENGRELVVLWPLTGAELAHYVVTQPEVARSRAVLVETYRRITDFAYPPSVVRQIATQIDGLAAWLGWADRATR
jgi:hypothetical protein